MNFHLIYSNNLIITTTCLILLIIPYSDGSRNKNAGYYGVCSSLLYSCGPIKNIGYPFWGDTRPEYCGQKEFKLRCRSDNSTQISIDSTNNSSELVVSNITLSSHTLLVHQYEQNRCWILYKRPPTFALSPFNTSASVGIARLYTGCPTSYSGNHNSMQVSCWSNYDNNRREYYYFANQSGAGISNFSKSCNHSTKVLVLKKALDKLNHGNGTLQSVLETGFELEYPVTNLTTCSGCHKKGGTCGSSGDPSWNFVCYYPAEVNSTFKFAGKRNNLGLMLGLGICICILIIIVWRFRKCISIKNDETMNYQNLEARLRSHGSLVPERYTYHSISKVTNSFSEKIGEGGYAIVYKGKLRNGRLVAVKLLKQSKDNGEDFINEVVSMGTTNHVNIVRLLGFCFERNKRALVYEFMTNGSLEKFTFNGDNKRSLPWETLFSIAVGIAKGLEYLHRGCNTRILHFDIKPHNILLDEEFCPKISDFGLARFYPRKESIISMLETRGTIGYIAPELFCRNYGGVSHKSDVYSYGMMILDMVCGRANIRADDEHSSQSYFPEWIYNQLELGDELAVTIEGIMSDEEKDLQRKMILVSLWCIQTYPSNRPPISKVVEMLEGSLGSIQIAPKPFLQSPPRLAFNFVSSSTITS